MNPLGEIKSANEIPILVSKTPQYCMAWDEIQNKLYTGDNDGLIHIWDFQHTEPIWMMGKPRA